MTLDWPNLGAGAIFGLPVGIVAHWAYVTMAKYAERRQLAKKYRGLTGSYANYRVQGNGVYEETGGRIILQWQRNGSFTEEGLARNGVPEWRGVIRMNLDDGGTGKYRNVNLSGHGIQNITYMPETGYFSVMGTITSQSSTGPFFHEWRPIKG